MHQQHFPSTVRLGILAWFSLVLAATSPAATQFATNSFTWDNGSTVAWGSVSGGPYASVWTSGNDAVFEGVAGTVTLASPTAHNLTFNTTGYILSGASTLTLNGTAPTISVGSGLSTSIGNNTAAVIGGSAGLTKSGTGTLTLNGSAVNSFTGGVNILGGTLTEDFSNLASPVNLVNSGNALSLAGGGGLTITGKATGSTFQTNNGTKFFPGYSPVIINRNGGTAATLAFGALTHNPGGVVDFQPATAWTTTASTTEIVTTTGINGGALPGSTSYFGAWALNGTGTATRYAQVTSGGQVVNMPSSTAIVTTGGTTNTVYSFTANVTQTGNLATYGLLANNGSAATFATSGFNLTNNGVITIAAGGFTFTTNGVANTGIVVGTENEFVAIANSGSITINAPIMNKPSNASSVTLGGSGTIIPGAQSVYTGGTYLIGGGGVIVPTASSTGSAGNPTSGPFGAGTAPLYLAGGQIRSTSGSAQTIGNAVVISADTTFPTTATEKSLTFTGPVTLTNGTRVLTGSVGTTVNTEAVIFSGAIGDNAQGNGITKLGSGKIILSGANTYSGPTVISAGTLQIGNAGTSGSLSTSSVITDNGTLIFNRTDTVVQGAAFAPNPISGTGALIQAGSGTLILTNANTYTGQTTVSAGTIVVSNTAALGTTSQVNVGGGTLDLATDTSVNQYTISFGSNLSAGTMKANRATVGAAITHSLGTLFMGINTPFNAVPGQNVSSGTPTITFTNLTMSSGVGGGTSTINPTNVNIFINGPVSTSTSNGKTLGLSGTSTGNVINGSITNNAAVVSLSKVNTGTWTINGTNYYTGTTTVSAGTLALGANASISNTPTISVAAGATLDVSAMSSFPVLFGQTLTGAGTVNGTVAVASGGKITPGSSGVGTLTNSAITLASGALLEFEFATGSNDTVNVTANNGLVLNGGSISLYNAGGTTPFTTNGTYNLFAFTGSVGGTGVGALSVANAQVGKTYSFGTAGNFVTLTIGDAPVPDYWNVNANGSWATGANWLSGNVPDAASAIVNFSSTNGNDITAPRTVTLDGGKTLGALTFSNSTAGFTINAGSGGALTFNNGSGAASIQDIAGSHIINSDLSLPSAGTSVAVGAASTLALNGTITSAGNLSQSGSGTLVLGADNAAYSGNTTVASGSTLQVGAGASAGSLGSGNVTDNGALVFNRNDTALIASNNISGSGTLTQNGSGTTTLSGVNSYSGATTVSNGTLVVSGGAAIADAGGVSIADVAGATLKLNSNETIGSLAGGGSTGGAVDLQANLLTVSGSSSNVFAGTIGGSGALVKAGSGILVLSGANTHTSGTTNIGGILVASNSAALGSGTVTIGTGATRLVVADGLLITNNIVINGGGVSSRGLIENSGAGNTTLSNGVITINAGLSGGGDFASTGGGTLTIWDPINASVSINSRLGTVQLGGGGSYSTFQVNDGTLRLLANNGISTSATVDIGPSGSTFPTLDLAGFNQSLVGLTRSVSTTSTVTNSSTTSDSTLTLTGTSSYPGSIKDAGAPGSRLALVVSNGNFTVSGASTFSGGTLITSNGVVNTTANAGLGTNIVTISSNSTLNLAAAALTLSEGIAGSGTVNVFLGTGTSSTLLNNVNTGFTGTLNLGTNAPAVPGSGKVQINGPLGSGSTVNVYSNATVYVAAAITQPAALVLNGGDTGESFGQLRLEGNANWSGPITLAGDITGSGDATIGSSSGQAGTISGNIGESGGSRAFSKVAGGTITLSGSNSFSGPATLGGAGIVIITSSNALGTTAAGTTVASFSALHIQGGIAVGPEALTLNGTGISSAGALRNISGTNSWAGDLTVNPVSTLARIASDANQLTIGGNIAMTGLSSDQMVLQGSGNIIISGAISGAMTLGSSSTGTGVRTLSGANTYTGPTVINGGTVVVSSFNSVNGGTPLLASSSLGAPTTVANGTVRLGGASPTANATLIYTGTGETSDRVINLGSDTGTATIDQSGSGLLKFTSSFTATTPGTKSLVLQGSTSGSGEIAGAIVNSSSGVTSLNKTGNGTWTLSGTNTYTGNTIIGSGTLALSGSGSIISTNILVAGNAVFDVSGLSSAFTLATGQTLTNSGSTALLAGNANSGTGTVSLTFASGTQAFEVTNGTLTLASGTVFKINNTGAALGIGTYKLIGKLTGGAVAGTLPPVTVSGGGTAGPASLQIVSGELYLAVGATTLALVSSASTNGYLDSVNFTATVLTNGTAAGNASGNVTFSANGTPFSTNAVSSGGATSSSLNTLPRGTNLITAVYPGDANYLASSNIVLQIVTNHPPVAASASYTRNSGISTYRITISELLTNVSDVDSDTITLVAASTSTNGITLVNSSGFLLYANTNNVADQFTYTVTDGFGGTNSGTVNFVMNTNVIGQITGELTSFSGGVANLTFHGIPDYSYITQRTTNLVDWLDISTNTAATNGVIDVSDTFPDLGGVPPTSAYYRLKYNP